MFERVITQTIQTISQQVLRERPLIALSEILEEERIPYRFKPFFETEVYWWLHNEMLARSANKRFDYENPEVASLLAYLEQVQFRHARFEREEFMSVLDSAVKLSYNYLCRPQITLKWYLFRGQPVKPLREVMLRFGAFVDYSYFFHVFSEWVERKIRERPTFDAISATEFERIIRRVDDQILLSCTVEDLLSMMDPLFEFIGEGDDLIIPIDALIIFFDDKNINKLVEHLERIRERGMTTVGKEEFVGLLDELLTSADENPEADFSNVYQNDELDDVVRMHLQSGAGRAADQEEETGDGAASAAETPGYIPPGQIPAASAAQAHPAAQNPVAGATPSHLRPGRAPVDPAFLDALDDDGGGAEPERLPSDLPPLHSDAPTDHAPVAEEDPERFEREILPEPDPEPIEEEEPIVEPDPADERPASSWSAPAEEDVNEEIEEWVEGLAEALGEWEESPVDPAVARNGHGASDHVSEPEVEDVDERARDVRSDSPVEPPITNGEEDEEIAESPDMLIDQPEAGGATIDEEESPVAPTGGIDLQAARVQSETESGIDDDHLEEHLEIDDDLVEAVGTADIAQDDVFESDEVAQAATDDSAVFEIEDLEDEFEDDAEGDPAMEGGDADLLGDQISGMLSGYDSLLKGDQAGTGEMSHRDSSPTIDPSAWEQPASERQPAPAERPTTPAEPRNGLTRTEPARPAEQTRPVEQPRAAEPATSGMLDVRRYIDAMLERKLVKKIFMRDRAAYDAALDQINRADTWRVASQILDEIFIRYEIDPYSRTALRFTDSVYARYLPGKQ